MKSTMIEILTTKTIAAVFSGTVLSMIPVPFFQILGSCIFSIYFAGMIKMDIIDKKYNGSWINFIKNWFGLK